MSLPTSLPSRLEHVFAGPKLGVLGLVDELLAAARQREIRLTWRAGRCLVEFEGGGSPDRFEVSLPKSVVRAILARVATLCNQRHPDSVSPFGGQGELIIEADRPETIRVAFANTPEIQSLELIRVGWAPLTEVVNLS